MQTSVVKGSKWGRHGKLHKRHDKIGKFPIKG